MTQEAGKDRLSRYTGEFQSQEIENNFWRSKWKNSKIPTRNAMFLIGFMGIAFFLRDLIEVSGKNQLALLLFLRIVVVLIVIASAYYIHRVKHYFSGYHYLVLFNQILIAVGIFILVVMRDMPVSHLGINTILFTLIYYQFMSNRFRFTLISCTFFGTGGMLTGYLFLNMNLSEFIASLLFLVPINILGATLLRSINRSRRYESIALDKLKKSNVKKEELIHELQDSLAEVKTLRGFLPICSKCKSVRDDEGYWNRIELYLKEHSDVEFSHSICPECAKKLYGDQKWFKKTNIK